MAIKKEQPIKKQIKEASRKEIVPKEIDNDIDLILTINKKVKVLQDYETFIVELKSKPELIFTKLFFDNLPNNDFLPINDKENFNIQKYFVDVLQQCKIFKNPNISITYDKHIFPSNIKIHYNNIPIFILDLVKKEYFYICQNIITEENEKIELFDKTLECALNRVKKIMPIKLFIGKNYNELNKCFIDKTSARNKFFEFYFENKKFNEPFSFIKTKIKFYFDFNKSYMNFIDEVLTVYNQVNETINKYEIKKAESLNNIELIKYIQPDIDVFAKEFISLLISYNYNIR